MNPLAFPRRHVFKPANSDVWDELRCYSYRVIANRGSFYQNPRYLADSKTFRRNLETAANAAFTADV